MNILGALLLVMAGRASACQCRYIPFEVGYASSSAVALVEILSAEKIPHAKWDHSQEGELQVLASWKGALRGKQKFEAGGLCGYWFAAGKQYLLYGSEAGGRLGTHLCTRTREYSRAEDELKKLGPPNWTSSKTFRLTPRIKDGLAISIKPVKTPITIFDDPAFDVQFKNRSPYPIRLPQFSTVSNPLISLVVRKGDDWWTTIEDKYLEEYALDSAPLKPGETRTTRLKLRGNHFLELADYSVQAVLHFSTSTSGYWTGYLFSDATKITKVEHKED